MRQAPEEKALLEAAIAALSGLLSPQLSVKLTKGRTPTAGRLRVGQHAEFQPVVRPGWRGPKAGGELATGEVLVVPYVSEAQGEQLRAQGTRYLDRAGNAWLADAAHDTAVLVQGRARPREARAAGGLAFGKTGVRLLYALLAEPQLVKQPYRAIAGRAGLPVATVGRMLLSLQAQDYLVSEKTRRLVRVPELRRRWVAAYGETVRPKLVAGRYRWLEPGQARSGWQALPLPANTWWGGEPAAHLLLDGYLLPQDFTLYSTAARGELMRALRLVPDPAGAVQVLIPLEGGDVAQARPDCVPPLLVYADLVLSGDPRNQEVADRLYAQYLKHSA
ncbi:MAG: type IV toxin-antitoxin system AbiEi family antitoxin [Janthinobacterium lividum]